VDVPQSRSPMPLAMTWHNRPGVLPFDPKPLGKRMGWYRFTAPPGLRTMTFFAHGQVRAWANGREMAIEAGRLRADGARQFKAAANRVDSGFVPVALRIEQQPGYYAGAALPDPIALDCVGGKSPLGDWATMGALEDYSGGAWYRKTVTLRPEQVGGRVILNLGNVAATAAVHWNRQLVGIRVAPPWTMDVSKFVCPGENRLEILVYNTLANHYGTIPTNYRGLPTSGLLGPVWVETLLPTILTEHRGSK
jgi:hypothetical protein